MLDSIQPQPREPQMKKSNKALSAIATFFILVSFILSPVTAVFADEKPKETAAESGKTAEGDAAKDSKDKKKKKDGEEPDCE